MQTFTFSASTNTDLGEHEFTGGSSDESDSAIFCDRIGAKAILCEYIKNKAARQLPESPSVRERTTTRIATYVFHDPYFMIVTCWISLSTRKYTNPL